MRDFFAPGMVCFPALDGGAFYRAPLRIIEARHCDEILPALHEVEAAVAAGHEAAGFIAYEAAPAFDPALATHPPDDLPLLWFGLYRGSEALPPDDGHAAPPPRHWRPALDAPAYGRAIAQIHSEIAKGNTYQANFTFPLRASFDDEPWAWFQQLYRAQPTPYAAAIHAGSRQILSVSPELFFQIDGDEIVSEPMKGTASRGRYLEEDEAIRAALCASEKERAENVMIADMVRNDLGRICAPGSVRADLFRVERHPTVWQMTSRISGRSTASVPEVFRALFPAASVTGAPKIQTTRILRGLEAAPRGVYCGAIGWWRPGRRACFSVAIRTAVVDVIQRTVVYSVGSGITWDADPVREYDECLAKAAVLTQHTPEFQLIETMRCEAGRIALLSRHLDRLCASARYFDLACDRTRVEEAILRLVAQRGTASARIRLLLSRRGEVRLEHALLPDARPMRLAWAAAPVNSRDIFLFHKTTRREIYEAARAACPDAEDVLLFNERGEVTESTIANIVVESAGKKWTPARLCGLLAGVLRAELLARGEIEEAVLTRDDITRADRVWLINSLRGWMETAPPAP